MQIINRSTLSSVVIVRCRFHLTLPHKRHDGTSTKMYSAVDQSIRFADRSAIDRGPLQLGNVLAAGFSQSNVPRA